jgi:hypothetical protein
MLWGQYVRTVCLNSGGNWLGIMGLTLELLRANSKAVGAEMIQPLGRTIQASLLPPTLGSMRSASMNTYRTTDMEFATVLYCLGKKVISLDQINPKQKEFVFEDGGDIQEIKLKFINRELVVDPKSLGEAMKSVKSMLYSL